MPIVRVTQRFPFPLALVVDFFRRPAQVVAVAPAEFGLRLVEAPAVVEVGSHIVVEARRWGIRQRIVTEVTQLDGQTIVEEQRSGPFRQWRHTRTFAAPAVDQTEVEEAIDFEPPGGLLGLTLTAMRIETDLRSALAARHPLVMEIMARSWRESPSPPVVGGEGLG
jgi:ligand-binding SRPBCC domain-containing protein